MLSASTSTTFSSASLEQLLALNDELAALARAGVPLDQGLLHLGGDLPGRLGRLATEWGARLERGESLPQVLENSSLPPAYRALVTAGLRSGRLAVALEGMSSLIRRVAGTRRLVIASLLYPVVVVAVAYGFFAFTVHTCFPVLAGAYADFAPSQRIMAPFMWLNQNLWLWLPWPPLLLSLFLGVWWFRSGRALSVEARGSERRLDRRLPSVRSLLHAGRMATFADVLAALVEQQVPLPEALTLAAEASGDRSLAASGRQLAEQLVRGERPQGHAALSDAPILGWLVVNAGWQPRWQVALRRAAESYRQRAVWMSQWLSLFLPFWLTILIGGTAAIIYAVSVFGPWSRLLYLIGQP